MRERIGQRRDAAQPRGPQDGRHVVGRHAQVGVVVGRHRGAVAHLVGGGRGRHRAGEQQRQRGRAVAGVAGLEVVGRGRAIGLQPAVDLHQLGGALGLPGMFLLTRQLHPHRPAHRARQQRRVGGDVVGAVAAVAASGFQAHHVHLHIVQAGEPGQVGAQHMRVLGAGPHGEPAALPVGHRARRADGRVQLVGPQVAARHRLRGGGDGARHVTAFQQQAARGGVGAHGVFHVVQARQAGPGLPVHLQRVHRGLGLVFTFGHDADEVADDHHVDDAGHMGDGLAVHRLQRVADEVAGIDAGIRRAHHTAMQHAGQAHVVHEGQLAGGLGGDVHPRYRLANHAVLVLGLQRHAAARQLQQHLPAVQVGRRGALLAQPGTRLRGGLAQRQAVHLQRGAGDGGALVGHAAGVAHQHGHLRQRQVQLFGHQLRQRGAQTGAQVHMAVQAVGAAVFPQREQDLRPFGRVGRHGSRLTGAGRRRGGRIARDQQHAGGSQEAGAVEVLGLAGERHQPTASCCNTTARRTAARISRWVPQRHRWWARASRICASVGCGQWFSSATVAMTMPLRQ